MNLSPFFPATFKYEYRLSQYAMNTFTAIITKEEDMYVAKCPEIGTASQGSTIEEAVANLKEATTLYLEELPHKERTHPLITSFEVSEIAKA